MPQSMPLTTKISQSSGRTRDYRTIRIRYGNGYEQRAADGINATEDRWVLLWENMSLTDYNTVQNALNTSAGVDYFNWTPFGDTTSKKFVIDGQVQVSPQSGGLYSLSVPMRQVFDL